MSDIGFQNPKGLSLERPQVEKQFEWQQPAIRARNSNEDYSSRRINLPSTDKRNLKQKFSDHMKNFPSGKVFKNGSNILKPAKAYDIYKPEAIYLDQNKHADGQVQEINGNLYARGENPIIEYKPSEQVVQPNGHIVASAKNTEADRRLMQSSSAPYSEVLPKVMMGAVGVASFGYLTGLMPMITVASLATAGGTAYVINESNNPHSSELSMPKDDFSQRMARLI